MSATRLLIVTAVPFGCDGESRRATRTLTDQLGDLKNRAATCLLAA